MCLAINTRISRQAVSAGNVHGELFHILLSHLLSVLSEAIALFITCSLSAKRLHASAVFAKGLVINWMAF